MKTFLLRLFVLGCCFVGLQAGAASPHPTQVKAIYRDSLHPVTRVIKTDPLVMIEGKERRLRTKVAYYAERADGFAPEYIEVTIHNASTGPNLGFRRDWGGAVSLDVSLTPLHDVSGSFILITAIKPDLPPKTSDWPQTYLVVRDLPDLKAGVETREDIRISMSDATPGMTVLMQVFDANGREIPTSVMRPAWKHYHRQELIQLRQAMPEYLKKFASQDRDAFPLVRPAPYFPRGTGETPKQTTGYITVSPDGKATDVAIKGHTNDQEAAAVREALMGWLFFPKLIKGQPIEAMVEVPIQF